MASTAIESKALRQAELTSEVRRILGLLAALGAFIVLLVARAMVFRGEDVWADLPRGLALIGAFMAYEAVMLRVVRGAIAAGGELPAWVWNVSVVVEAVVPTLAILIMTEGAFLGPYRALLAPALGAYFIFIVLSTLRLSPGQSRLMGAASAAGYMAMILYTYARYPEHAARATDSAAIFATYAAFLLLAGLVAGAVAGQIRGHVAAALREARSVERMEHDLELARTIQQGLLPTEPPKIEGFEIAGWNRPADQTGGDYFDWQELADGRVAVTLADVTGHGIGPALVTAVIVKRLAGS